jgi:hypothetical protein
MFFCFFASADDKLGGKYLLVNEVEDEVEDGIIYIIGLFFGGWKKTL